MGEYIFRFPAEIPLLTYAGLEKFLDGHSPETIGETMRVSYYPRKTYAEEGSDTRPPIEMTLYGFTIALITEDEVKFLPYGDDGHMTTTAWLSRIARDNGIADTVGRVRRRAGDGPGVTVPRGRAGLLVLDWDRRYPVVRQAYPVQGRKAG